MSKKAFVSLFIACGLLMSCSSKKDNFSSEKGKYFVKSLNDSVSRSTILKDEQIIPLRDFFYVYNLSFDYKKDIVLHFEPTIVNQSLIALNDDGQLTLLNTNKFTKIWTTKAFKGFCSNLSTGVSHNTIIASCGNNIVKAFDLKSGKIIWENTLHTPIASKAIFDDNNAIVFGKNDSVYALNIVNGKINWMLPSISKFNHKNLFEYAPLIVDQYVIQQTFDDQIRFINTHNGSVDAILNITDTQQYVKGKEFLNAYGKLVFDESEKAIYSVNSDGAVIKLILGNEKVEWMQSMMVSKQPLVLKNHIIVVNEMGNLIALSKITGQPLWKKSLTSKLYNKTSHMLFSTPVLWHNNILMVTSDNHMLILDSEDGHVISHKKFTTNIFGQPFIVNDKLCIMLNNGSKILVSRE